MRVLGVAVAENQEPGRKQQADEAEEQRHAQTHQRDLREEKLLVRLVEEGSSALGELDEGGKVGSLGCCGRHGEESVLGRLMCV